MESVKDRRETGELRQFISFSVGEEEYGLELLRVKEVIRIREITWLPKAPTFVKGIINLRGDVIPIIDLRAKFGLESRENSAATRVIVVEVDGRLMGMVVDSASQVVRIPADQIDPPPPVLGGFSKEFITGVGKLDDKLIILLNTDAILTIEELQALGALDSASRSSVDSASRSSVDAPAAEPQPAGSRA
jgi:purine-binding chemotaxis protein CheW